MKIAKSPLLCIVGETASGKTALAVELARRFNGEIICADSRTVYAGMDIGTAKPTAAEQAAIPHHGLDLIRPDRRFSAAEFKNYAQTMIVDIAARGKLPIVVGGTGLYIDALVYDYQFRQPADPGIRARLESLSLVELQRECMDRSIAMPYNDRNRRHLIRTLETAGSLPVAGKLRPQTLVLGITTDRTELSRRVAARIEAMFEAGFVDEVRRLYAVYGDDNEALRAPGYRDIVPYLRGEINLNQVKQDMYGSTMKLAKRQRTWFRRNKSIHWLSTEDKLLEAVDSTTTFLNK